MPITYSPMVEKNVSRERQRERQRRETTIKQM